MTLSELIERLKQEDPERVVPHGFFNPHSWRGSYDELAFEPTPNIAVSGMLKCALCALGHTYQGYKGGDFTMDEDTNVHIAVRGDLGEPITEAGLTHILSTADQRIADLEDLITEGQGFAQHKPECYRASMFVGKDCTCGYVAWLAKTNKQAPLEDADRGGEDEN